MKDEKETFFAHVKLSSVICLEGLRKITGYLLIILY
jgi:hypothetical protein